MQLKMFTGELMESKKKLPGAENWLIHCKTTKEPFQKLRAAR